MKKLLQGILIISLFLGISNVKAENSKGIYYTNKNNVAFTKFQYDTVVDVFGLDGLLNMDLEQFANLEIGMMTESETKVEVLDDHDVVEENANEGISTLDTKYGETSYKKLTGITTCKSGYNYCILTITLDWKKNPSTRSYDVIGTRISNSSFTDDVATAIAYMNGTSKTVVAQKRTSIGRAAAIKLSDSGNIDNIGFVTHVKNTGFAQVSYQHAVKTVTQVTALNFTFSAGGMGGVFAYADRYMGYYDDMAGVSVKMS